MARPGALLEGGLRVWSRNRVAFMRAWKVELGGVAVEPFVLLLAMGFGLGAYVGPLEGQSYARFVAPGVLAMYATFHATFDSTYGAYLRMETHHIYEAMLFTPLGPSDIVLGEVLWSATRSVLTASAVLVAASVFGLVASPLAVLALPAAFLIGMSFAALAMVLTSVATTIGAMNNFFTLFVTPLVFIGGSFFPLERLPGALQALSWALPFTPGVSLVRALMSGEPSPLLALWALELVAYSLAGLAAASYLMGRRLRR